MQPATEMTLTEYLALDPGRDGRIEWLNERAYAMSGARPLHNVVTLNVAMALGTRLRGQPCRAMSSDQRVHIEATGAYVYPDVVVVCPPWSTAKQDPMSVTNPVLLVEVLSPSTRDYDLGGKLSHYRRIPSLQDILYVDPDAQTLVQYTRDGERWVLQDITSGSVELAQLGLALPLAELFADLEDLPDDARKD